MTQETKLNDICQFEIIAIFAKIIEINDYYVEIKCVMIKMSSVVNLKSFNVLIGVQI